MDTERAKAGNCTYAEVAIFLGTSVHHLESWLHGSESDVGADDLVSPESFQLILERWGRGACD